MGRVLYLITFRLRDTHRAAFLEAAERELKPYWESHGVERFEVYDEIGPTGPTGRITQAYWFPDREGYLAMQKLSDPARSEEHTSELQSQSNLVCRLLLEKKKKK